MLAAILTCSLASVYGQRIQVVDQKGNGIALVSVTTTDGNLIGMTDIEGVIADVKGHQKIGLSHLAYQPKMVNVKELNDDKVTLLDLDYNIAEIVVKPKRYIYVETYYRLYLYIGDSLTYYRAGILANGYDPKEKKVDQGGIWAYGSFCDKGRSKENAWTNRHVKRGGGIGKGSILTSLSSNEKYKEYYQKKKLLPKAFLDGNTVEEIQGVYVPFWLFDGAVTIDAEYEAVDKEDTQTETIRKIYRADRRGNIKFKNVPADASKRMPDDIMDSIEPFKFEELKDFNMMYLPGFLAEKFDVEGDDDLQRAEKRVINTAKSKTQETVKHDEVKEKRGNFVVNYTDKKYAMLPVWYLTTNWNGKQWNFAMNGQTGKFTGDLPVDYKKLGIFTGIASLFRL